MPDRTFTNHPAHIGSSIPVKDFNPSHFTLTTPPGTDIWRPSISESRFDGPSITTPIRSGTFKSLECTISGSWATKFDQGGLLLLWPAPSGKESESKWLKTGIEFFEGKAAVSVVGTDRFSDWSLSPLTEDRGDGKVRIRVERDEGTLWLYALSTDGKSRRPLREIRWAWMEGREEDARLTVGVCAAKPAEEGEELKVVFEDWVLETTE